MKRLRFRMVLLTGWLILFYSIERIFGQVDISDGVYLLILAVVMVILLTPRMSKTSFWIILAVSITLFLLLKGWVGDLSKSTPPALVVLEITAVLITTLLGYWMSKSIHEFEQAVSQILIARFERLPELDSNGQGLIYREVRRARNHQRPLALMTIEVNEKSLKQTLERMVQEVQLALMTHYKLSGLSRTLRKELEDCAVILQKDDHFVIALPETKPEEVPVIIDRLRRKAAEQIGVELEIGSASFPDDGYTFEGLIDKATVEMKTGFISHPLGDFNQVPSGQSMSVAK